MAENATIEIQTEQKSLESKANQGEADINSKLLTEALPADSRSIASANEKTSVLSAANSKASAAEAKPENQTAHPKDQLPQLHLDERASLAKIEAVLPWTDKGPDGKLRQHMSYLQIHDAIVKLGEGPHHVAKRLMGPSASDADVKTLTQALIDQYKQESGDQSLRSLRNGHRMLTESNVIEILSRITDEETRLRVIDKLEDGWRISDKEPPIAVPFEAHHREGETRPNRIDDPEQFLKDLTKAMVNVKADEYWAKGLCAAGFRLAINQLPLWRIDGGSVDKSINKDINGWRSGVQMALDLAQTGLFDVVPLKELGYKNLKQGYIVGRWHYPDYVKARPRWGGEDFGDIDVWTPRHKPKNDDASMYRDSFVLIPKGILKKPEQKPPADGQKPPADGQKPPADAPKQPEKKK